MTRDPSVDLLWLCSPLRYVTLGSLLRVVGTLQVDRRCMNLSTWNLAEPFVLRLWKRNRGLASDRNLCNPRALGAEFGREGALSVSGACRPGRPAEHALPSLLAWCCFGGGGIIVFVSLAGTRAARWRRWPRLHWTGAGWKIALDRAPARPSTASLNGCCVRLSSKIIVRRYSSKQFAPTLPINIRQFNAQVHCAIAFVETVFRITLPTFHQPLHFCLNG